ncbi:MAG: serine/threonine protein kinase [Gemmataceae bacterium]|nr:serine/threonine protein kinase [Gemmataceae bacterium]
MPISTPSELLDWLAQYQFLSPAQADELRPLVPTLADRRALAGELIRRNWLTPYQANQILTDKHEHLILGGYRLRERIGEGAMGQVYKAWSLKLERMVAVKMIKKEMVSLPKAMDRFRREVETAAQLHHPNIALVLDADDIDGRPFLVMEFIDGFNLSQRVTEDGAVPIADAVEYSRQAALGLQHAFERGIVHRDIKPANLMVTMTKVDDELRPLVKILDFGLARYEIDRENSARLTQIGMMLGTIDYVAPEQATDSRNADIRADIYSLGCALFYLIAARPAFLGSSVVEKLGPRVTGEPPWIREVRPGVDPGLEAVLLKIMARRPEDRYQTPIEVAEALAPYATTATPVPAAPRGVVMAMPVAPGAVVAGSVPIAQPILAMPIAPPAPPEVDGEASFMGMTATGRDMSTGAAAHDVPSHATPRQPIPRKVIVISAGVVLLLSLLSFACLLWQFFPSNPDKKAGIVRISRAKWSMHDEKAIPGRPHHVLVWIERVDCKGPVIVTLKNLPPGVTSDTLTIPPRAKEGQIGFIVSFGTQPLTKVVKVFAECAAEDARDELSITLTIKDDPLKVRN